MERKNEKRKKKGELEIFRKKDKDWEILRKIQKQGKYN